MVRRTFIRRRSRANWIYRSKSRVLAALAVATVFSILLGLALFLRFDSGDRIARSEPIDFFLDGQFSARFAGEMIAQKADYFEKGVRLVAAPSDSFVADVVSVGGVGVTTGQKFLLAAWRGIPVTAFAASYLDTSIAVFTLESSGLRRPSDLLGRKIGIVSDSGGETIFDALMAQVGLPRSRIGKVKVSGGLGALERGEVDAIVADVSEFGRSSTRLTVIKPQDYGIHVPGLVYFADSKLLSERPLAVGRILTGIINGWRLTYSNYAEAIPIIVGFDPKKLDGSSVKFGLDQQRDLVLPTGGRIGEYDESRWRTLRDILKFEKLGEETTSSADAVNYQLLRDVYRRSRGAGESEGLNGGGEPLVLPK